MLALRTWSILSSYVSLCREPPLNVAQALTKVVWNFAKGRKNKMRFLDLSEEYSYALHQPLYLFVLILFLLSKKRGGSS